MNSSNKPDTTLTRREQHNNQPENTETTMSESNNTTEDEQNEYQVAVWVKREFTPQINTDSKDSAEDEAREFVCMEHGIVSQNIQSTTHESVLENGQHQVSVWAKQEIVETVTAQSERDAEDEAREFVCMEHGIATRDVLSTNVEAVR